MNNNSNSTLLNAARDGSLEEVKLALKNGANVNHREEHQWTALYWASFKGHTNIVQLLLKYKADPNILTKYQETALHYASHNGHAEIVQLLLKYKADPNIRDKDQETVLHWASQKGHTEIVQLLLRYKADPNICDKDQRTALHVASLEGNTEIVELLLKYKADPNICDKYQETALHYASRNGQTEIVQFLLKYSADPNVCDKDHQTALLLAIIADNFEMVQLLLRHNADPNISDKNHWTPLHYAIINMDIVQLLLQSNADPNICNEDQETVLHFASHRGFFMIVQLLLQYNADLNICNKDQRTALHMASRKGHVEIVHLLLQSEVHLNICDKDGSTALHVASHKGHVKIVQLLLEFNADPNICDKDQSTALHVASHRGQTKIVKLLLEFNADPNICDKDQSTALHDASHKGHTEIVKLLLQFNADPNICDKDYHRTPLHLASKKGHTDIILLLLQWNADPNISTKHLWTALYIASKNGYSEIVQILLKANADPNICDENGNTALHHACKGCHTDTVYCLLSNGADQTVKNSEGKTSLDEASSDEIVNLLTKHNPKRVLEEVSKWDIENIEEEQIFEKFDCGVKLVLPPSSVEKEKEIKTEIKVIAPKESEIILPPDVELVSCFYKIETTGKFSKPIELHLQHNVELTSLEQCKQLAFIKAKGPPPCKFEVLPTDVQEFRPYDNFGVVRLCSFSPVAVVYIKRQLERIRALFQQPSYSYIVTVFVKQIGKCCWDIQAVVTKNLGPFLKRVETEAYFNSWKKIKPVSFFFDPVINEVTITNEYYEIKPMIYPFQVSKKAVDKSQPDTALHYLKFKASLKNEEEVIDLELNFKGTREERSLVIASYDLEQIKDMPAPSTPSTSQPSSTGTSTNTLPRPTSVSFPESPISSASTQTSINNQTSTNTSTIANIPPITSNPSEATSLCQPKIRNDLLNKEPKKRHLIMLLHSIKHKWYTIGEQLDVRYGDIVSTEAYEDTRRLSEILQVWIDKRTSRVCWSTIITVIEEPPIEHKVVAYEIYQFLTRPDIQNEYLSSHDTIQVITTFNSPPPIPPKTADKKSRPKSFYSSPLIVSEQTNKKARPSSYLQPPIAPKSAKKKDEMKEEATLQSSNLGETPPIALKPSQKKVEKDETKQESPLSSPNHTEVRPKIAPKPAEKKAEIGEMKQKGLISSSNPIGVRPPIAPKPAKKLAKWDEIICLLRKELKEDLTSPGPEPLPFTELLLKKPKKRHLMMLLDPIKYEWGSIAAKLKVQLGEINSKCFNKAHYDTRRLSLILKDWIDQTKNHEERCWKTIVAVVEEPPIKNRLITSSIHQFLAIPSVQDEYKKTDHVDTSQKLLSSLKESHISWLKEKPNLHDLLMLLCPIKYEWPIIGEQLGVFYDNIKSEDHDVAHDDVQRLNQILEYWINQKTSVVSWESILSIIIEPPIKEHDIVITICDFLTKHYGNHEDKPSHAVNPLPALNEVDSKLLNQKPKLLDLCELLHTIKHKWQDIGEQLQVKDSDINISGDDTINLSKVLLLWINQRPCDEVHWKKIIDTINDPPINNIDLANEICHFLANPHIQKANNISMVLCKEPKQGDLMKVLGPIADEWQNIGEALGMKTDRLKDDASVDDIFLLYTVMRKVLKNSRVTWKTIIDVVRNKPIYSQVVADMIEEFLSRDDVYSRYTS